MIKLLRQHLLENEKLLSLLDNKEAIYHLEKPLKVKADHFIVFNERLLEDKYIKTYQLTFNIESPNVEKVISIEEELIKYLNDVRCEKLIKNEDTFIRNIQVLNGGGKIRLPEGNWRSVIFFLLKL
ncbi:hypothetical protein EDC18_102422 [Natranaerovirga pectinivora]|uniref:Uncharacterized protein n=1 Tax=Natranaerovirga pectinivora TaxID=682400 RepID=A0A4R3MN33_9FIRM|nr:hypothetical protein [Natranaerovirga pectinivora]TCT16403.1 hypothetical protein EDC18_102422 [Natranaerovirga pectinivora]